MIRDLLSKLGQRRRTGWDRAVWVLVIALLGSAKGHSQAPDQALAAARQHLEALGQIFRHVYQQVAPAVVMITTPHRGNPPRRLLPPSHLEVPEDQPFEEVGSGTIVRADGYILSNYHVIKGADSILVTLTDRRVFRAEIVGYDSLIDIALLRIEARGLPTVRFGDSEAVQIGDWVLAIGHPLGQGSTLTHGIVSALGRQAQIIDDLYGIESFIQTNAVINPGNSGGPLIDLKGAVIGINTAITTRTGYYIGYGLAVPSNLVLEAMDDILNYGRVVRGYLGVGMAEVTQEMNQRLSLGLEQLQGVYLQVLPNSPAARAGVQDGDLLLAIDGQRVEHPNQVQALIYRRDPGEQVELTILRSGVRRNFQVILGEREEDRLLALGQERLERLGIAVAPLSGELAATLGFTPEVAAELGFAQGEGAIVVVAVDPGSLAAARGIEVHDIITEVDQQRITSPQQLVRVLSGLAQNEGALFWLWRPGQGIDVRVLKVPQ